MSQAEWRGRTSAKPAGDVEAGLALLLRHIVKSGTLQIKLPDGSLLSCGDGAEPRAEIAILDADALARLLREPELALGELYMDGKLTVAGDNIDALLALLMRNRAETVLGVKTVRRAPNTEARARANAAHHYDLSNDFFELFLDRNMQYSCAYFEHGDETLDEAQERKLDHIARKLRLDAGDRVLDIGSGWGGLAMFLAEKYGARVKGITLSENQLASAKERAAAGGLSDRTEFAFEDYRRVGGAFDRIVSVGMFEHVGRARYDAFFKAVAALLVEDGVALIHTIGRTDTPKPTSPWTERYIFPGGYIPSLSDMAPAIERSGLCVTDIEVWRLHYAKTLRAWRERFEAAADRVREMFDERFVRMWRFYLAGSEAAFRHGPLVVFQIQLAHRKDAVPLTRDYLYAERS